LNKFSGQIKTQMTLCALTVGALLVQGYHPFSEDAEIYLPGMEKILDPKLFPVGQEFFLAHARMTLFPNFLAWFLRITHLPPEFGLFFWHIASIYLLLLACWQLSELFFSTGSARWGGVCLMAALLSLPVAGTALYIMDQYLNPRNLAAFAGVFALARLLEKKYLRALLWIVFAGCMHPLMWVFPASFCVLLVVMELLERCRKRTPAGEATISAALFGLTLAPAPSQAYHQAALKHAYHYIQHWAWYEVLGAVAPLILFWWFGRIARGSNRHNMRRVSRGFVIYGFIYLAMALLFDLPPRFEALARLQPLRSLHFLYIVMFVMIGGLLGEFVLKQRVWRWVILFVPLSAGMVFAQRQLFPASVHVEWPGLAPRNPWAQAFVWIRANTPSDAVFALDPNYMTIPGEDEIGFRCLAERSRLADAVKDNGVVSMFPPLAEKWWAQVQDQTPWNHFSEQDFLRLKEKYGAGWVVLRSGAESTGAGMDCPYRNAAVQVCRIP
jgi:hypothetical protein